MVLKGMRRRFALLMFAGFMGLVVLTGCSASWSEEDVVGTWVHADEPERTATLTLEASGDLRVEDVPRDALVPRDVALADVDWSNSVTGKGTWELAPDGAISLTVYLADGSFIITTVYAKSAAERSYLEAQLDSSDIAKFRFDRAP